MNSGYDEQIDSAKKVLQGTPESMGGIKTAAPHEDLIRDVLDPRVPKSEREHAAAREIERLKKSLTHTAAHLAAAISLLERGGKAAKKAAPSDKMFDQMLLDYKKALSDARVALAAGEDER